MTIANTIAELIEESEWDRPFFKKLAKNDTGAAAGHQGGMVIPKDLRPFFPGLVGSTTATQPTIDRRISAELYDGTERLGRVRTRYQFQTWGGTRPPESRLTDELSTLRNRARGDDLLIIQRSLLDLELYRLVLVKQSNSEFSGITSMTSSRWGVLGSQLPMSESDYRAAESLEASTEAGPFSLFEINAKKTVSSQERIARSIVFRDTLTQIYGGTCCVCGTALISPDGPLEVEGAHIVPRRLSGADDARNGLALCRRHHWAFDWGMFGIDSASKIIFVPKRVAAVTTNKPLADLAGKSILAAVPPSLAPDASALDWHATNILIS